MPDSDQPNSSAESLSERPDSAPPRLAARAAGSSVWSLVGQIYQVVLGMASFALLTRWLTPADYGVLGMAATVSGFLGVIGDSGMTNAVMRLPQIDDAAEATAFWLSLIGGAALTLVAAIAAPILAWFYKNSSITWISFVLAFTFLLGSPMRVSLAKLSRAMRFREITLINMVVTTLALALTVALAMRGFGVWALVAQGVSVFVLQSLMVMVASPPKMRLRLWSRDRARDLSHVASRLSGFSLSITIGRALDNILAGRFLGSSALGFMGMGMKLVFLPVERLGGAMYSVFLPAAVELGDDARQAQAFKAAARLILMVVGPFSLGTVAIAPEIVALLPPRWFGLEPVLRIYALTSLFSPISYLAMSVLVAHGRAGSLLRAAIAFIPMCWAAAILGVISGSVVGMVAAWSFSIVIGTVVFVWLVYRRLSLGADFWTAMLAPVSASLLMACLVRISVSLLGLKGTRIGLAVGAVEGALLYGALAWLMMRPDLLRVVRLLKESRRKGSERRI
jgi:O-antigen/teichoic acid export membrane protein